MREVENKVGQWHKEMLASGVRTPVPMEELEAHLRDAIEEGMRAGLSGEDAFVAAWAAMGAARDLSGEFKKVRKVKTMKRITAIVGGVLGVFIGMAFVMPAVAQWREGVMTTVSILLLSVGLVLVGAGGTVTFRGLSRKRT